MLCLFLAGLALGEILRALFLEFLVGGGRGRDELSGEETTVLCHHERPRTEYNYNELNTSSSSLSPHKNLSPNSIYDGNSEKQ